MPLGHNRDDVLAREASGNVLDGRDILIGRGICPQGAMDVLYADIRDESRGLCVGDAGNLVSVVPGAHIAHASGGR